MRNLTCAAARRAERYHVPDSHRAAPQRAAWLHARRRAAAYPACTGHA